MAKTRSRTATAKPEDTEDLQDRPTKKARTDNASEPSNTAYDATQAPMNPQAVTAEPKPADAQAIEEDEEEEEVVEPMEEPRASDLYLDTVSHFRLQ